MNFNEFGGKRPFGSFLVRDSQKFAILSFRTSAMHVTKRRLVATQPSFNDLHETPVELQQTEGYAHTLAEIWQQPELWVETARRVSTVNEQWSDFVSRAQAILLTGSG